MLRYLLLLLVAMIMVACGVDPATTTTAETTSTTTTVPETASTAVATTTTAAESTTTKLAVDVTVAGGQVEGPDLFEVGLGDLVEITVLVDVADEIHVHGYDLRYDTAPGVPVTVSFDADALGIFEVELEASRLPLFEIQVAP
jgi:hypothetical protein